MTFDRQPFKLGPYQIAQSDYDGKWRVWTGGVVLFSGGNLSDALEYARKRTDEYATTVKCTLCGSRPGQPCVSEDRQRVLAVPHMARVYARERLDGYNK